VHPPLLGGRSFVALVGHLAQKGHRSLSSSNGRDHLRETSGGPTRRGSFCAGVNGRKTCGHQPYHASRQEPLPNTQTGRSSIQRNGPHRCSRRKKVRTGLTRTSQHLSRLDDREIYQKAPGRLNGCRGGRANSEGSEGRLWEKRESWILRRAQGHPPNLCFAKIRVRRSS